MPISQQKSGLRQDLRLQRQLISDSERSALDQAINTVFTSYVRETEVSSLAAFWPFDGEPDIRSSLHELVTHDVTIALPVPGADSDPTLTMHQWLPDSEMKKNRFGIEEPFNEPLLDLRTLDVIFVPLVAWDKKGGRLGMGAGFYDRLLEPLSSSEVPLRLGLAFGLQEVTMVPTDDLDIPMHGLICEHGWTVFNGNKQADRHPEILKEDD